MPQQSGPNEKAITASNEESEAQLAERSYALYQQEQLAFDPLKDLNLPESYDEVMKRFNRLQGDKPMEVLN